ncbi:MAG: carboxypeptidase regulatory-like domain-containing protein [Bacteroidota bacterium]|nr:carboxypeptidase regulatory-like domain-containing protein [Bacteroidota bacterium]
MKRFFPVLVLMALVLSIPSFGQNNGPEVKADKLYMALAYHDAIDEYQKVLLKEPDNANALRNIADCFRLTNNTEKSELYYSRVVELPDARPIDKLHYAQSLMYNQKYEQAKEYLEQYGAIATTDERATNFLAAISKIDEFVKDSAKTRVTKVEINSDKADFSPVFYKDGIVFTTSRESGNKDRTHSWTGNPFLTLYYAAGTDANLRAPELFAKQTESKFNDGPASFNSTGDVMYLTRNNSEVSNKSDKVVKLKIVETKFVEGNWSAPVDLPFVNKKYNAAHAWITKDGNKMFFSSDMPGGYGGMDIYVVHKKDNKWGSPVNVGNKINTKGNELFPCMNVDTMLYFSSDGLVGMGGLDVFYSNYIDSTFSAPVNMGYPMNTHRDDFGLVLDAAGEKGYLSSNRNGGKGDDDIYFVQLFKDIIVTGTVTDKRNGQPIEMAEVVLKDREGKELEKVITKTDGTYEFKLEFNKDYTIVAQKLLHSTESKSVSTFNITNTRLVVDFQLFKISIGVEGIVSDKETGQPLDGATVSLVGSDGKEISSLTTKSDGYYYFELVPEKNYKVKGSKEGYFAKVEVVSTKGKKEGVIKKDLPLEKLILNKAIRLDNIYYDLAKWNIRPDAAKELDKLVQVLKDNPTIVIELSSHTDCRASDTYNMDLSDKRAKSAAKYIVEKGGIAKDRITGKGYGETVLINRCANGVKCSESEHQENRRTEFKVLKF